MLTDSPALSLVLNAFDHLPTGVLLYEFVRAEDANTITDLRLVYVNQQTGQILNRPADELVGTLLSDLFPETALGTERHGHFLTVAATGQPHQRDSWWTPPGATDPHCYNVRIVRLDEGILVTYTDVTAQRRAEQERDKQAQWFEPVFNSSLLGVSVFESMRDAGGAITDFRLVRINEAGARFSRRAVAEVVGQTLRQLYPLTVELGFFDQYVSMVEQNETLETERYYPDQQRWYAIMGQRLGDGFVLTFQDITRRRQQHKSEQQADLLQTVVDNSPTGLVLYEAVRDAGGQITDFIHRLSNPTNEAVTGRPRAELEGLSLLEHYPTNRENGHFDVLVHVTETGEPLRRLLDYRAHGINGCYDAYYVKQGDGVLFTYLDVTETHEQRVQLEAANRDLARSNENLAQFAYVASHDLQEPLRKIQSFGSMLQQQPGVRLDAQATEYVSRMQRATERMSLLIRDLLAYSRLSTQRDTYRPVELNRLIDNILDDLSVAIGDATVEVAPDLPTLPGDSTQLRQLFQNLLSNALKFRKRDGPHQVRVTCRPLTGAARFAPDVPAEVGIGRAHQVFYEISVQDNGIGFNPRYTDRIFQVFQRLHGKGQYVGSGVGLAICKKVVDNHYGAITASSQPGQGATFRVYLPGQ